VRWRGRQRRSPEYCYVGVHGTTQSFFLRAACPWLIVVHSSIYFNVTKFLYTNTTQRIVHKTTQYRSLGEAEMCLCCVVEVCMSHVDHQRTADWWRPALFHPDRILLSSGFPFIHFHPDPFVSMCRAIRLSTSTREYILCFDHRFQS